MRQTAIGNTDVRVGAIAFGCWRFAESSVDDADTKIRTALDAGMTLIDTADIYGLGEPRGFGGAEAVLGEVLQRDASLRSRMFLATKGGIIPPRPYDSSHDYLTAALEASLTRLNVDMVDLYQIHRPDLIAPVAETARALNDMLKAGKTRFVGVSNFTVAQTRALQAHLDTPLASTQPEFSALHQDPITDGTFDWCSETGATALAWSPLARGSIPRKSSDHPRGAAVISCLQDIAEAHGASVSDIALAFTMKHQAKIIPIIGTQNPARITDSANAADLDLSAREFYDIIEAYCGEAMP